MLALGVALVVVTVASMLMVSPKGERLRPAAHVLSRGLAPLAGAVLAIALALWLGTSARHWPSAIALPTLIVSLLLTLVGLGVIVAAPFVAYYALTTSDEPSALDQRSPR